MNLRAFKAIFLKAFGRNGNGGAQASKTTFVLSLVFIVALVFMASNLILSRWINRQNEYEGSRSIIVINAPESFNGYIYDNKPKLKNRIIYQRADAAYDFSEYSDLMDEYDAYMTIYFPSNFEEEISNGNTCEILSYVSSDKLKYSDWHDNFSDVILEEYQDYIKISSGVPVGIHECYEADIRPVDANGKSNLEYSFDYFGSVVIPLVTFIVILYAGMSKGTNAVAGQKEKGTLTGILLTPVKPSTIVMGNLCGIWLGTTIPALIGLPILLAFKGFRTIEGFVSCVILIFTLALLVSAITLMISILNDTVVSAQTAFLPVFFILLGVCILCIQSVNDIEPFYFWIPVYGHFYGMGQMLIGGEVSFIDIIICTISTFVLSGICIAISTFLLKTERFTTTVESYSDRKARKYLKSQQKLKAKSAMPPKATIFDYAPTKYIKSHKLILHHIRYPLIILSICQVLAIIPAAIYLSKTNYFHDIVIGLRRLKELDEVVTTVFDIFGVFMAQPVFIFCMGITYYLLIAIYILKVKFIDKNKICTLGIPTSPRKIVVDYLKGIVFGLLMIGSVYALLVLTGKAEITGFGVPSELIVLFIADVLMWLPQGASEELMFRGYMMPRIGARFGTAFAVFFSSLLFGVFHAANVGFTFLALINLTLIAVSFALICLYNENIIMTCAMHTFWNFAQGNLFGLQVSGNESAAAIIHTKYVEGVSDIWTGGDFGPEGGLFVTLVSLVVIGIMSVLLIRKKNRTTK